MLVGDVVRASGQHRAVRTLGANFRRQEYHRAVSTAAT